MKRTLLLTLLLGIAACGQKGPLYFAPPPEPETMTKDAAAPAEKAETGASRETQQDDQQQQ